VNVDLNFTEPVRLETAGGFVREVRSAHEAFDALHAGWPETRAKWYHAALRACSSAIEGRTGVHVARRIFVEAARESRLHN